MSNTDQMPVLSRADYKAIKHMDKERLTSYLYRIYMRGVERGRELAASEAKAENAPAADTEG